MDPIIDINVDSKSDVNQSQKLNDENLNSPLQNTPSVHVTPIISTEVIKVEAPPKDVPNVKSNLNKFDKIGFLLDKKLKDNIVWQQKIDKKYLSYEIAKNDGKEGIESFIKEAMDVLYKEVVQTSDISNVIENLSSVFIDRWTTIEGLASKVIKNMPEQLGEIYGVLKWGTNEKGEIQKPEELEHYESVIKDIKQQYASIETAGEVLAIAGLIGDVAKMVMLTKNFRVFQNMLKEVEGSLKELQIVLAKTNPKDPILEELCHLYEEKYKELKNLSEKFKQSVNEGWKGFFIGHSFEFIGYAKDVILKLVGDSKLGKFAGSALTKNGAFLLTSVLGLILRWQGIYKMKKKEQALEEYSTHLNHMIYKYQLNENKNEKKITDLEMDIWIENNDTDAESAVKVYQQNLYGWMLVAKNASDLYSDITKNLSKIRSEQLIVDKGKYFVQGDKGYKHEISEDLFVFLAKQLQQEIKQKPTEAKRLQSILKKKAPADGEMLKYQLEQLVLNQSVFRRLLKNQLEDAKSVYHKDPLKKLTPLRYEVSEVMRDSKGEVVSESTELEDKERKLEGTLEQRQQIFDKIIDNRAKEYDKVFDQEKDKINKNILPLKEEGNQFSNLETFMKELEKKNIPIKELELDYLEGKFYVIKRVWNVEKQINDIEKVVVSNELAALLNPQFFVQVKPEQLDFSMIKMFQQINVVIDDKLKKFKGKPESLKQEFQNGQMDALVNKYGEGAREIKDLMEHKQAIQNMQNIIQYHTKVKSENVGGVVKQMDAEILKILKQGKGLEFGKEDTIDKLYEDGKLEKLFSDWLQESSDTNRLFKFGVNDDEFELDKEQGLLLKKALEARNALRFVLNEIAKQPNQAQLLVNPNVLSKEQDLIIEIKTLLSNKSIQNELASRNVDKEQVPAQLVAKGLKAAYSANLENKKSMFKGDFYQKLFAAIGFTAIATATIVVKLLILFTVGSIAATAGAILPFLIFASTAFSLALVVIGIIYMAKKNPGMLKNMVKLIPLRLSLGLLEKSTLDWAMKSKVSQLNQTAVDLIKKHKITTKELKEVRDGLDKNKISESVKQMLCAKYNIQDKDWKELSIKDIVKAIDDLDDLDDLIEKHKITTKELKKVRDGLDKNKISDGVKQMICAECNIQDKNWKKLSIEALSELMIKNKMLSRYTSYMNMVERFNYLETYNQGLENQITEKARLDLERMEGLHKHITNKKTQGKDKDWSYFAQLIEGLSSGKVYEDPEIQELLKLHGIDPKMAGEKIKAMNDDKNSEEIKKAAKEWLNNQFNVHLSREVGGIVSHYEKISTKEKLALSNQRIKMEEEKHDPNILNAFYKK